jgi:hypothetical protein
MLNLYDLIFLKLYFVGSENQKQTQIQLNTHERGINSTHKIVSLNPK